jgi:gas vesicle protein
MAATFSLIAFAAGVAVVAVSFALVVLDRASDRGLLRWTAVLGVAALAAAAALGINLVETFARTELLVLAVGGLAAAALAEAGLFALARGLRRGRAVESLTDVARDQLAAFLEKHTSEREAELERRLAREEANAIHVLGAQQRKLAEERRDTIARQADKARAELADAVASEQERLERRLAAWAADLDRGQRRLEGQVADLAARQREAVATFDARLAADSERVAAVSDDQRAAVAELRAEFSRVATQLFDEGKAEIESLVVERRRALHEMSERLRVSERALGDEVDRQEADARRRLAAAFQDAERRQLERFEKALERAAGRLSDDAERRFDAQIRQEREKAAERLSRELDKAVAQFARSAEKQVSDRIADVAQRTAERLEARLDAIARAAETEQQALTAERLKLITDRLDEALAGAEERIAAFEAEIEIEVARKLADVERGMRTPSGERL